VSTRTGKRRGRGLGRTSYTAHAGLLGLLADAEFIFPAVHNDEDGKERREKKLDKMAREKRESVRMKRGGEKERTRGRVIGEDR